MKFIVYAFIAAGIFSSSVGFHMIMNGQYLNACFMFLATIAFAAITTKEKEYQERVKQIEQAMHDTNSYPINSDDGFHRWD